MSCKVTIHGDGYCKKFFNLSFIRHINGDVANCETPIRWMNELN